MAPTSATNPAQLSPAAAMERMLEESVAAQTAALHLQIAAAQAARSTPIAALVAHPDEISGAVYLQHMQAMQQHYVASPTAPPRVMYALPLQLLHLPATALAAPTQKVLILAHPLVLTVGAKAMDAAVERIHQETLLSVKVHASNLAAAAAHAQSAKMTTAQFTAYMNALREKDKQSARAQLDRLYASLIPIGNQHADQRGRVLQTANHSGNFLATLAAAMQKVSHDVEAKAAAALHALTSPVKAAVDTAGNWASGAVKTVGSFFSHLF